MIVKLLTKHHLEFLSLKGGCTGSSESTLVKMPHCWESHVAAQIDPHKKQMTQLMKFCYLSYIWDTFFHDVPKSAYVIQ